MTDPRSFGEWLRRERERRGITLRAISDRTKIGAGLLEGLERGDVSRWPGGIYRRAFVRAYAGTVGLDEDLVVANFERLFPSDPSAPAQPVQSPVASAEQPEMRLALVPAAVPGLTRSLKTAGREMACILALALGGYAAAGAVGFWCAAAVSALGFHLSRLFGLPQKAFWHVSDEAQADVRARAQVLSFTGEQARSTRRRTGARRILADLSAAAASAATLPGRRRAARS